MKEGGLFVSLKAACGENRFAVAVAAADTEGKQTGHGLSAGANSEYKLTEFLGGSGDGK
jgi:hypothetical protein